jgi:hypothetical protein
MSEVSTVHEELVSALKKQVTLLERTNGDLRDTLKLREGDLQRQHQIEKELREKLAKTEAELSEVGLQMQAAVDNYNDAFSADASTFAYVKSMLIEEGNTYQLPDELLRKHADVFAALHKLFDAAVDLAKKNDFQLTAALARLKELEQHPTSANTDNSNNDKQKHGCG